MLTEDHLMVLSPPELMAHWMRLRAALGYPSGSISHHRAWFHADTGQGRSRPVRRTGIVADVLRYQEQLEERKAGSEAQQADRTDAHMLREFAALLRLHIINLAGEAAASHDWYEVERLFDAWLPGIRESQNRQK